MPNYYVDDDPQSNGDYIVHKAGCVHLPYIKNRTSLGYFRNGKGALLAARRYYRQVNGCDTCVPECYTQREDRQ